MLIEINIKADPTDAVDAKMLAALTNLFASFASFATVKAPSVVAPFSQNTAAALAAVNDGETPLRPPVPGLAVTPSAGALSPDDCPAVQTVDSAPAAPPLKRARRTKDQIAADKAAKTIEAVASIEPTPLEQAVTKAPVIPVDAPAARSISELQLTMQRRMLRFQDGSTSARAQAMLKELDAASFPTMSPAQVETAFEIMDTYFPVV